MLVPAVLVVDFMFQNALLYLLWTSYIPEKSTDGGTVSETIFISDMQEYVFFGYLVIYTAITLLPQIVVCITYVETRPDLGCVAKLLAKTTLLVLSVVSLHQIAMVFTVLGRVFKPVP